MSSETKTHGDGGSPDDTNPLGLSQDELDCLSNQIQTPPSKAGYLYIYQYAKPVEVVVMILSGLMAAGAGATTPLMTLVLGSLVGDFSDLESQAHATSFMDKVNKSILYFVYIAIATLVLTSLFVLGFSWTGERITKRLRTAYLQGLLRQNIAFLDFLGAGEAATRITADLGVVQDGVSQKVGLAITGLSAFVTSLVITFVKSWRLALVMLCLPIAVTSWMVAVGLSMKKAQQTSTDLYSSTASFAEEAISSLRHVAAYGLQAKFVRKYEASLTPAINAEFKAKYLMGLFIGGLMGMMLSAFALAGWAGSRFLDAGDITISQIVTVMFASMIASVSFGQVAPHLQAFAAAGAAVNRIAATIDRQPTSVRPDSDQGVILDDLKGDVEFQNMTLVFPGRISHKVLDGVSLSIPAGQTTAIIGASGSGKSSLLYLLQRFYLPVRGRLLLDGQDVQGLDLRWLRSQMRMVSQESFLFNTTVFDNIAHGLVGTCYEHSDAATKARLVEQAARDANAHEFIVQLPRGYETLVGESGGSLSGGQRQRIAIARALVSDPKILLLDEATSSLDSKSEALIQDVLVKRGPSKGRTTVIIAHRLSTIRHAQKIVVMDHGSIVEQGTHEELLVKNGNYASLVNIQSLASEGGSEGIKEHHYDDVDSIEKDNRDDDASQKRRRTSSSSVQISKRGTSLASSTSQLIKFLLRLNRSEATYLILGMLGSALSGLAYPITGVLFGNMIVSLRSPSLTLGDHSVSFWAGMQALTALFIFLAYILQGVPLAITSAKLVGRARTVAFAAILRQDLLFFTKPGNSAGVLTAFLAQQANQLNGLSGTTLGAVLNSIVALVAGFTVAICFGWKLGLVATSTMPLIFTTGYARYRLLSDLEKRSWRDASAASVASEAIRGVRTIAALGLEETVLDNYTAQLGDEIRAGLGKTVLASVLYGTSQSVIIFCMALIFWYGGTKLLPTGEYSVRAFLICFISTAYSAQSAGGIFSHAPDVAGAREATERLKVLCETVPEIDITDDAGESATNLRGELAMADVSFAYPSANTNGARHPVLRNITLSAPSSHFIALVGASGSGKSTVMNLLERLHDPDAGQVMADERDIRVYNLRQYRKQLAIVEQDAVLYTGTILENLIGDEEEVDVKHVQQACEDASIWDFVKSLPEGIHTAIGQRGSQVSGGQKQRLAIARALLRNPKVLLLDEATSALDSHSEAAVQQALARVAVGRTTIAIAHRLSSISHADCIYVFDNGSVVEMGTHIELLTKKGLYWQYVGMQNIGTE